MKMNSHYLFDYFSEAISIKDLNGNYLYFNNSFNFLMGGDILYLKRKKNMRNALLTDGDFPFHIDKHSKDFKVIDEKVITFGGERHLLVIDSFSDEKWRVMHVIKQPLYDGHGYAKGVITKYNDILSDKSIKMNILFSGCLETCILERLKDLKDFDDFYFNSIKLTDRELECLFFILRGKTAKEIGIYFDLSHRTVEKYILNLRMKFHAKNRLELQDKAMKLGYYYRIPKTLIYKKRCLLELSGNDEFSLLCKVISDKNTSSSRTVRA